MITKFRSFMRRNLVPHHLIMMVGLGLAIPFLGECDFSYYLGEHVKPSVYQVGFAQRTGRRFRKLLYGEESYICLHSCKVVEMKHFPLIGRIFFSFGTESNGCRRVSVRNWNARLAKNWRRKGDGNYI
mmetsp:Transcript_2358/g.7057  ORF Transcript_2358/g.7057 Transcript_2358/m.7057 type:complete len:128 (+) Transcript_2358:155-538(+)